ncbi:MAG: winged helix DNA-binding domain-containing protein [Actinomycetota bacterium]|nr:winged helix DNA-binding domain-containing protein [Actinomycetota bacterium]
MASTHAAVHQLSASDARRIAVRAQLLAAPRPTELLGVVRQLTLLQYDQTAAVAPNADLILWSRLGSSYSPRDLQRLLDNGTLVELQGMIRPRDDMVLYRAEMADWPGRGELRDWQEANREWVEANDECRIDILERLEVSGPLTSRELPDTCAVPWISSGWNNNRNVLQLLEIMARRGEVAVAGRRGRDRLWDLAFQVYPDDPVVPADDALRIRNERRLAALGIARSRSLECPVEPADVGGVGEPAVIDGVKGTWRVDPAQLGQSFAGRTALLSPLDRLVFDRARMVDLFDFDYQLGMYKPAAKRRFGYFALPILYGEKLVGKLDATADRKSGVFRVDAIYRDVTFSKTMTVAVDREITELARWLGLELQLPG